jgi:glycosyltransferase involved in cell wall biosynthesis
MVNGNVEPPLSSLAMPPISVTAVLATHNRAHYLTEALDSILGQTRPPEELIVVDDGSTDDTEGVVKRYGEKVRYFKQSQNVGKSATLNFGIPLATKSHIWICDDDDVALPDALGSHVEFLTSHPDTHFSYSSDYRYSGSGSIWQRQDWVPKSPPLPDWPPELFLLSTLQEMNTPLQGMLIPKRCLIEVGLFDPTLPRSMDLDLLVRLAEHFKARNIQKPTLVVRDHGGPRGSNNRWRTSSQRRRMHLQYQQEVYRKFHDRLPLGAYLPREPGPEYLPLSEDDRARALIHRACMLLAHGLDREALKDFAEGLGGLHVGKDDSEAIRLLLSKTMAVDPFRFRHRARLIASLNKTFKAAGYGALLRSFSRGTYWSLRRAMKQHAWRQATVAAAMLVFELLVFRSASRTVRERTH